MNNDVEMKDADASTPAAPVSSHTSPSNASTLPPKQFFLAILNEAQFDLQAAIDAAEEEAEANAASSRRTSFVRHSTGSGVSSSSLHLSLNEIGNFKNRLNRRFDSATKQEGIRFLQGLQAFINQDAANARQRFIQLMLPTKQPPQVQTPSFTMSQRANAARSTVYTQQESIIRVLLLIQPLQADLVKMLMEKLEQVDAEEERKHGDSSVTVSSLILTQLRYLDQVHDSKKIASELTSALHRIRDAKVLGELISAIPEVIEQNEHKAMVQSLMKVFNEIDGTTGSVLDTLLHLQMNPTTTTDTINMMLDNLATKPIMDLPVIVRFIIQASSTIAETMQQRASDNAATSSSAASTSFGRVSASRKGADDKVSAMIGRLRRALNLSQLVSESTEHSARVAAARAAVSASRPDASGPLLTIESLQQSIRFHPIVGQLWLRELKKIGKDKDEYHQTDIWMLFILFKFPNLSEGVLTLIKQKIASDALTVEMLSQAVEFHADVVHSLFPTILQLCEELLHTSDPKYHLAAVKLQSACFIAFPEYRDRALIVDAFVVQIGNIMQLDQCNASLAELWHLTTSVPVLMEPFQDQPYSLIEFLHTFNERQVVIIADILATIAVRVDEGQQISVHEKFHILCSKHLHSSVEAHHRIGVSFMVAALKRIGGVVHDENGIPIIRGKNSIKLFRETYMELCQCIGKLAPIEAETRRTHLYDALSRSVISGELHESVLSILSDEAFKTLRTYLEEFNMPLTFSSDAALKAAQECTPSPMFNLDEAPRHIVSILPTLADPRTRPHQHRLVSSFRICMACFKRIHDEENIEHFKNTMASPLFALIWNPNQFENHVSDRTQHLQTSTFLHSLNWFRECVSSFSMTRDQLICTRLRHLMKIHNKFDHALELMKDSNFVPYGLTTDLLGQLKAVLQVRAQKKSDAESKKSKEKTDYVGPLRPAIHPFEFDVFTSLLSLPLSMAFDEITHEAMKVPKAARITKSEGAAASSSSSSSDSPSECATWSLVEQPELSVQALGYLLHELCDLLTHSDESLADPLTSCKFQPIPSMDDTSAILINSTEKMRPIEIVQALMSVLPNIGEYAYSIVKHLNQHLENESDETLVSNAKCEQCLKSILEIIKFLLLHVEKEIEQKNQEEVMQQALAAFVEKCHFEKDDSVQSSQSRRAAKQSAPGTLLHTGRTLMLLLLEMGNVTQELQPAVNLIEVMELLWTVCKRDEQLSESLRKFADLLLTHNWVDAKLSAKNIGYILNVRMRNAADFVSEAKEMLNLMDRVFLFLSTEESSRTSSMQLEDSEVAYTESMTLKTAQFYLKAMLEEISSHILQLKPTSYSKDELGDYFIRFSRLTELLSQISKTIMQVYGEQGESTPSSMIFGVVLKQGRVIFDSVKSQEEHLSTHYKHHTKDITNCLTYLGCFSTIMETICEHAKQHQVASLQSQVTPAKTASSALLQMTRIILVTNNAQDKLSVKDKPLAPLSIYHKQKTSKRKKGADDGEEEEEEEESKEEMDEDQDEDAEMEEEGGEEEPEEEEPEEEEEDIPIAPQPKKKARRTQHA